MNLINDPLPITIVFGDSLPDILQELLKRFVRALREPVWNEVEPATYHQAAAVSLRLLSQLMHFPHLERRGSTPSSSVAKALRVVKKLCSLSMTKELIEVMSSLAQGKVYLRKSSATLTEGKPPQCLRAHYTYSYSYFIY